MQLHAGFVAEAVREHLTSTPECGFWTQVVQRLSEFTLTPDLSPQEVCSSLVLVAENIISRGLPTLASCFVEDALESALQLTQRTESERTGSIRYRFRDPVGAHSSRVEDALCIIDSRIEPRFGSPSTASYGSEYEARFHNEDLPREIGPYAYQVIESQRPISTLLRQQKRSFGRGSLKTPNEFVDQRIDFTVEFPAYPGSHSGLAIEVDGEQHGKQAQQDLDRLRDKAVEGCGWHRTLRIPTSEVGALSGRAKEILGGFFRHPYAGILARNHDEPLWRTAEGMRVLELALVPFAVARVEKAILSLVRAGVLSLEQPVWRIAVLERDVPCARLAATDLTRLLCTLAELEGKGAKVPEIQLLVYATPEFAQASLRVPADQILTRDCGGSLDVEVLLDVSVLRRTGLPEGRQPFDVPQVVRIRSSQSPSADRRVVCGMPITYAVPDEDQPSSLVALLRDIFRKASFREGQVPILRRLLARESTIGLLPTGAGKSLTYQMATLLQPGIALIVDPIKSLMRDQDDNLRRQGLDSTVFINSSLPSDAKKRNSEEMVAGRHQFVFISPERLMIDEFRDQLRNMVDANTLVAYVVVDEAHCVSEWGHEFRTAYLRLGANARKYCRSEYGDVPLVGLTGTASFDVLADVQRELQIEGEDAIVSPDRFERDELQFEIVDVPPPEELPAKDWDLRQLVAKLKRTALLTHLGRVAGVMGCDSAGMFSLIGEDTRAGLVFAPHVNGDFGVKSLCGFVLENLPESKGAVSFFGGGGDDETDVDSNVETQRDYKNNEKALLVATKAFGMGIDKPNIRYTIHFSMPASIESFYQEAGRAGRDRMPAWCSVLYCRALAPKEEAGTTVDKSLMLSFHRNSFKGVEREKRILYEMLTSTRDGEGRESPGLETLLSGAEVGDSLQLSIPFSNDAISRMAGVLQEGSRVPWSGGMVEKALEFKHSPEDFLQGIRSKIKQFTGDWPEDVPNRDTLVSLFKRVRMEKDTFKAVYRLSIVGAIREYSVDYAAKAIHAIVIVRPQEYYVDQLQKYAQRYLSPEEARRVPDLVYQRKGASTLQKCLGYLVDFVYDRIAKRRLEAISVMETAIQAGIKGGSAAFAQYVNTYFDSRMTPELRQHLYDYSLDVVWDFMIRTGGEADGLSHLRGACDRLLVENPENAALRLLRAFVAIVQSPPGSAAPADFFRAWRQFEVKESAGRDRIRRGIEDFFAIVIRFNATLVSSRDRAVLDWHKDWLTEFNDQKSVRRPTVG